MSSFAIRLDLDASRRSDAAGPLWGPVWFELDGTAFPAEGWDDAVDPAFTAWLREAATLVTTGSGMARLVFMDGPYEADFTAAAGLVEMVGRVRGDRGTFTGHIPHQAFAAAVVQACAMMGRGYEARGWDPGEWRRYEAHLVEASP